MILSLRTDKPEAELGLYELDGSVVAMYSWQAHRELAATLLATIQEQLTAHGTTIDTLAGVVVFQGPGSFTGLRIGITVANALAYGRQIPVVGAMGDDWVREGVHKLHHGRNDRIVLPEYGTEAHITVAKK